MRYRLSAIGFQLTAHSALAALTAEG